MAKKNTAKREVKRLVVRRIPVKTAKAAGKRVPVRTEKAAPKKTKPERLKKSAIQITKVPTKVDSAALEDQTIMKVDRTLDTIGDFLSKWEAAREKPSGMIPEIVKVRRFHEALGAWKKDAVKAKGKGTEQARLRRLRDFVIICRTYS